MDVKSSIEDGNCGTLRRLLAGDASLANTLVRSGRDHHCLTHPLHYVSDMLFEGALERGMELPLVEALIQSAADLDFQSERADGKKGDSPLIGAASLGAEDVGLKLLDAGAKPELRAPVRRDGPPLGRPCLVRPGWPKC